MDLKSDCISVRCDTEQEWYSVQDYLFSLGIRWPGNKKYSHWDYENRFIFLNFLDDSLCHGDGKVYHPEVKYYTTAKLLLRYQKLRKLKEIEI